MSIAALRALVDDLRTIQQRVSAATQHKPADWRQDVVRARRDIAARIGELATLTRQWTPPAHAANTYAAFQASVSTVRRSLAMHQALWPAVAIETDRPEFQESVAELRTAYDDLLARLGALEHAVTRGANQETSA